MDTSSEHLTGQDGQTPPDQMEDKEDLGLQSNPRPGKSTQKYTRLEWLQFGLFWSWNLIFLAFMSLGFAPIILPETFTAVRTGVMPASFLAYALVLALVPVATVILGLTVLRRSPSRLFALGYVIEGPLMLLLAVRFFAIRQGTPGTSFMIAIALLGMAAFLWMLLDKRTGERRPALEMLRLAGLTLMALTSLYAAAWIAFYAIPLGVEGVRWLGDTLSNLPRILRDLGRTLREMLSLRAFMLPFSLLGFILLLYTATLFVLTPIAVPYLSLRAWWKSLSQQRGRKGWLQPVLVVSLVIVASIGLGLLAVRQPQAKAFALLETPPTSTQEAQSLVDQSASIRSGLVNAYLAPFRYISAEGEVVHIRDIYSNTFDIPDWRAYNVQRMYEGLASPLLYQPVHSAEPPTASGARQMPTDNHALTTEPQEAARLYQNFFDTPITKAERPTIVRAARSTWSATQAEAAWQAVDDREVHLVNQEINVQEHGDWVDVELHEAYQNQTAEFQEVVYYFNLPESAVLTGVWLGNSPNKDNAFSFQVAPRGAAQAVYREETRKNIDPALLEQIGPRQYRLRIYPIPSVRTTFDDRTYRTIVNEAPMMYMWLTWRQMADSGGWAMPGLAFLRNVYWDGDTQRLVNGQTMAVESEDWLPKQIPAAGPIQPQAHRVDLPGGQTVLAIPADQATLPGLPDDLRLAVVIDRSRSMNEHAAEVTSTLEQLKKLPGLASPVDVYLTASPYRGEEPSVVPLDTLNPQEILYFGGQNAAQLIAQFDSLHSSQRSDSDYDAVIVLTDGTGYELGASGIQAPIQSTPIWIAHMGGDIPIGYDDQTLEAIQASGGGVAGSLDEILGRIAVSLNAQTDAAAEATTVTDLLDGYLWTVLPTSEVATAIPSGVSVQTHTASEPFAALAGRQAILAEIQRQRGTIDELDTLDALHALATNYGIVTPYSSMIVLVNSAQQLRLAGLSQGNDRYQREVEALGETTPGSPLPLTGVPEPHEWLLLGLAAALLIYLGYKKRFAFLRV